MGILSCWGVGDWATPGRARIAFITLGMITFFAAFGPTIVRRFKPQHGNSMSYLSAHDYELGPAIIEMAYRSAWGRWFAAQQLVTMGKPIDERYWFQTAAGQVLDKLRDGDLVVRGRLRGQTGSEIIPETDWRDVAFYYFPDNRVLWKLRVLPREAVTIQDDRVIHTDLSMETVSHITRYDNLLVDSRQFENLWPVTDQIADSKRQQFLKDARRRTLDANAIRALS
jgi:hypothetical protein